MDRTILVILICLFANIAIAATTEENLQTCLSGKYHSLCNYNTLTPDQKERAKEARRRENLITCLSGKYSSLCNRSLLSQAELKEVVEAERQENLRTCMSGKYKSLCKHGLLSKSELIQVREAERQENLKTCINGSYSTLCNYSLLSDSERKQVMQAEKAAAERAKQLQKSRPTTPARRSADGYLIEVAHNDELFIINGEKYEAQTYCLGWEEGEEVLFIEGSPYGACASAELYNLNRRESCDVWCE